MPDESATRSRSSVKPIRSESIIAADRLIQLGRFVPTFAHEINNCLQVIGGLTELCQDDPSLSPTSADRLRRLAAQVEKGGGVVRQLLAFARERPTARDRVDVHALLQGIAALRGDTWKRLRAEVGIVVDEGSAAEVEGSPRELEQMLLALLLNAEDAVKAAAGPRTIDVRVNREHDMVAVRISDSGAGVGPEMVETMFDAFVSGREAAEHPGLGLAAAAAIATRHGGTLAFEADQSTGRPTFVVTLPAAKAS